MTCSRDESADIDGFGSCGFLGFSLEDRWAASGYERPFREYSVKFCQEGHGLAADLDASLLDHRPRSTLR